MAGKLSLTLTHLLDGVPAAHGSPLATKAKAVALGTRLNEIAFDEIDDPGNAGAIPVECSGECGMTSSGADTRTLPDPTFVGQVLALLHKVDGGSIAITAAHDFDQATHNVITMSEVEDYIVLRSTRLAGGLRWRVIANDGCVLS
jgi:hypothetical protein